jgi:hypothetical protein
MAESADPSGIDLDREALLGVLLRHGVVFVLIGGAAIQSHGRRYDTLDIDLTPDTEPENLSKLASALNELDCTLITDPADHGSWVVLPSDYFTTHSLRGASIWNLATRHGQLDICFEPAGFPNGYRDLALRATQRSVAGTTIMVSIAALEDVHKSKREANRPKDQEYLRHAEAQ